MLESINNIVKIPELRKRLAVTFGLMFIYRLGFFVVLPYVDQDVLARAASQSGGLGDLMDFASAITGGQLLRCSAFALGIMPYISASIIFQLLVKVIPALEALSKEGESGRKKINQYTRYATVALCIVQSMFIIQFMTGRQSAEEYIVHPADQGFAFYLTTITILTTGTIFLMWLGEQISEYGIGNGASLIIMAGIVSRMPGAVWSYVKVIQAKGPGENAAFDVLKLVILGAIFVAITVGVVLMTQAQRRIAIQQARHTRGRMVYGGFRHYMPLRVNAAGVLPIIFAQSLLILPAVLLGYVFPGLSQIFISERGFWYYLIYLTLIVFFTYFWTSLQFNPVEMANNMKEYGSFVPGIRPGRRTADYLERIMNRITLVGAVFLVYITIIPQFLSRGLEIEYYLTDFLGGTGILIVVGVALDVVQKVESHLLMRHYDGFLRGGRIRGRR